MENKVIETENTIFLIMCLKLEARLNSKTIKKQKNNYGDLIGKHNPIALITVPGSSKAKPRK